MICCNRYFINRRIRIVLIFIKPRYCTYKFASPSKYYNINIGVEVTDGKYYMVFTSQLKPVEEIIVDDTDMSECEQELME